MLLDNLKNRLNKQRYLSKTIEELGLTANTYHCLRKARIKTVGDLVNLSWKQLMGKRNAVRKTCEEVEKVLKSMGLKLRED